jgi:Copper transport outer membrane protein, MctB
VGEIDPVISWRYHVVSIVAVVLALGLGLLAGTSVVGDRFIQQLEENYRRARQQRDAALETVTLYDRFATALQPTLRDGALTGHDAVVLTLEGVDGSARRTADEIGAAGADVVATLTLTRKLVQADAEADAAVIQDVLGTTETDPAVLRERIADELAVRLAAGAGVDPGDDFLGRLLSEGLITSDRDLDPSTLAGVGGGGELIVLEAGGDPPPDLPGPSTLLVPMTQRLMRLGAAVAVVGPTEDGYGLVSEVRDAPGIPDCSVVTVDDVDLTMGGIALAMGLRRYFDDPDPAVRPGGDYGVSGDAILPGAADPPDSCRVA